MGNRALVTAYEWDELLLGCFEDGNAPRICRQKADSQLEFAVKVSAKEL